MSLTTTTGAPRPTARSRNRPTRRLPVVAGAAAALLLLAACGSSDEPAEPAQPSAVADLPGEGALTDQSEIVGPGEWGVVKVSETAGSKKFSVVALKVTDVSRGEPGQLADVTSVTGNSELIKTGTPYWITIHWAAITGDGWNSPINGIWGWNDAADQAAMKLSLPASVEGCAEPSTQQAGGMSLENVDCAVAMFEDQSLAVDQVRFVDRTTYPEGDHAIRFALPTS